MLVSHVDRSAITHDAKLPKSIGSKKAPVKLYMIHSEEGISQNPMAVRVHKAPVRTRAISEAMGRSVPPPHVPRSLGQGLDGEPAPAAFPARRPPRTAATPATPRDAPL